MGRKVASVFCLLMGISLLSQIILAEISVDETETEGAGGDSDCDSKLALKVGDVMFGTQFDVIMVRKYTSAARPNGIVQLDCQVSAPGSFKAWVKDGIVVGTEPSLKLRANDPNLFGIYFCAADPPVSAERYRAFQFIITEMPLSDKTSEIYVRPNQDIALTCKLASRTGAYKWYKYNDITFMFEEIAGQSNKQLTLTYTMLNRNHGVGFTYYKCADPSDPAAYQAFKVDKDPARQIIDGRMTNIYEQGMRALPTDVASVPISVTPKSKVTFECHKVNPAENTKWYFRDNNTMSPTRYNELGSSGGVEIQENPDSSVLSVKDCDLKNKGYYRCNVGGVVKYAFLDIRVIVPTIHDYGKGIYDLSKNPGADNELECEIPIGGELKDVIWRIIPANGNVAYNIAVNKKVGDFETSISESAANQLVTIKFRDNPRLYNYRLECRLGNELDFVTLRSERPFKISIVVSNSLYEGYKLLTCTYDTRLTDVKFHQNNEKNDLPIGTPLNFHRDSRTSSNNVALLYYKIDELKNWFRCSGIDPTKGVRVYSDPVPIMKDPLK